MPLLSQRQYAAHRKARGYPGGQLSSVQQAIADGRISLGKDGKIDPEVADVEWLQNTQAPGASEEATDFKEARARREAARARLAEIEVAKAEGELIPRSVVESVYGDRLMDVLRSAILNIPGRWGAQIVGLDTPREGEAALKRISVELLEELSGPAADQLEADGDVHLPPDFPGRDALAEAGVETMSDLLGVDDLRAIPGIGPATERKIRAALEGRDAA